MGGPNLTYWRIIVHLYVPLNMIKVLIEEILSLALTIENDSLPGTPLNPRLRSIAAERRGIYLS